MGNSGLKAFFKAHYGSFTPDFDSTDKTFEAVLELPEFSGVYEELVPIRYEYRTVKFIEISKFEELNGAYQGAANYLRCPVRSLWIAVDSKLVEDLKSKDSE